MALDEAEFIWKNGKFIKWAEATTHVLTHGLHYGTSFFEGIRVYDTHKGPCVFRLREHVQRLVDSLKIYNLSIPYTVDELCDVCSETVAVNNLKSAYIRPIAYIGYGQMAVAPKEVYIDVVVAAFPWGAYLGEDGLKNGIDVCISSWNRVAPNTVPTAAKAGGNYLSGFLISDEAHKRGYAEGIGLTTTGHVSEGGGENLFVIRDGKITTPPRAASILGGITRNTVITLAGDLGIEVTEQNLSREALYTADELFFTGTAAEVTPIRSVDDRKIGTGTRGPITEKLQNAFFGLFDGTTADKRGWLTPVPQATQKASKAS